MIYTPPAGCRPSRFEQPARLTRFLAARPKITWRNIDETHAYDGAS